jgi:hypothetical protein
LNVLDFTGENDMNDFNFDIPSDALARVIAKCTVARCCEWPNLSMSREHLLKLQSGVGSFAHRIAGGASLEVLVDLGQFMTTLARAIEEANRLEQADNRPRSP